MLAAGLLGTAVACTTTLDPTATTEGTDGDSPLELCTELDAGRHAICTHALPWEAARHDCHLRGANLAVVESDEENELIAGYARDLLGQNVWLGAHRDDDFLWTWETGSSFWEGASDGTAIDDAYTHWAPGEPNDSSTVSTEQERCLALTLGGNDWNDRVCALELGYVCEWGSD